MIPQPYPLWITVVTTVDHDSRALLADANPRARLALIDGMNHVLKVPAPDDPQRGYARPELPISAELVEVLADFALAR